jgi:hypothetical protein
MDVLGDFPVRKLAEITTGYPSLLNIDVKTPPSM